MVQATHPLNMNIVAELSVSAMINVAIYSPRRITIQMIARICLVFLISVDSPFSAEPVKESAASFPSLPKNASKFIS